MSEIGTKIAKRPYIPMVLVCIENRKVLENLINQPASQMCDYGILHHNSYNKRGYRL
ncbi:MAG: hypothetical protein ABI045_03605 [Flavobacteriales bacterium]